MVIVKIYEAPPKMPDTIVIDDCHITGGFCLFAEMLVSQLVFLMV